MLTVTRQEESVALDAVRSGIKTKLIKQLSLLILAFVSLGCAMQIA